jgi:hypothetical protein
MAADSLPAGMLKTKGKSLEAIEIGCASRKFVRVDSPQILVN